MEHIIDHLNEDKILYKLIAVIKINSSLISLVFSVQDDPLGNLSLALEIAEKHLDIPKMLDPEGKDGQISFICVTSVSN